MVVVMHWIQRVGGNIIVAQLLSSSRLLPRPVPFLQPLANVMLHASFPTSFGPVPDLLLRSAGWRFSSDAPRTPPFLSLD